MKITGNRRFRDLKHQQGATLIELLIAGVISLIAVSGMLLVMASTLGTTTQTIEMVKLSQEMRTAMQIMTRELRRANYHPEFVLCYGNTGCLVDLDIDDEINEISIGDSVSAGDNDCLWFWYDRPQAAGTTAIMVDGESVAAFRRAVSGDVGRIQMTTTRTTAASCSLSADWVDITDPNIIDVLSFTVTNADVDFPSIVEVINSAGDTQSIGKIGLAMTAKLTADASVASWIQNLNSLGPTRDMNAFVRVRNNVVTPAP